MFLLEPSNTCGNLVQFPFKCVLPLYYVQGEGQGEALLQSQVGKQNPLFDVPVWPCSGNPEARLGRGWGRSARGGTLPLPLTCDVTDRGARPPLCLTAVYCPESLPKDVPGNLPPVQREDQSFSIAHAAVKHFIVILLNVGIFLR